MKSGVLVAAERQLHERYGKNVPYQIMNRFQTEKMILRQQDMLLWVGFLGGLYQESLNSDFYFGPRGAQIGTSFIAWLLGGTDVNPLPPHYYCPHCKRIEFAKNCRCGMDLPDKVCECGQMLQKDGFDIAVENMFPLSKHMEISISHHAMDKVKDCLEDYFSGYGKVIGISLIHEEDAKSDTEDGLAVFRYIIPTSEAAGHFSGSVTEMTIDDYFEFTESYLTMTVVEYPNDYVCINRKPETEYPTEMIGEYVKYAAGQSESDSLSGTNVLSELYHRSEHPSFYNLVIAECMCHGTDVWENNAQTLFAEGRKPEELIFCREDVYSFLYGKLKSRVDEPSGIAFAVKEDVRMGRYAGRGMPEDTEKLLLDCGVPDWYIGSMKKVRYVFPKTQVIMILKHELRRYRNRQISRQ